MNPTADCTLYSKTAGTETYARSVIPRVMWEDRKAVNVVRSGLLEADRAWVYIPAARGASINPGDVLVKGVVSATIATGYPLSKLFAEHRASTVRSVDVMDLGSPALNHLQVGGS